MEVRWRSKNKYIFTNETKDILYSRKTLIDLWEYLQTFCLLSVLHFVSFSQSEDDSTPFEFAIDIAIPASSQSDWNHVQFEWGKIMWKFIVNISFLIFFPFSFQFFFLIYSRSFQRCHTWNSLRLAWIRDISTFQRKENWLVHPSFRYPS